MLYVRISLLIRTTQRNMFNSSCGVYVNNECIDAALQVLNLLLYTCHK